MARPSIFADCTSRPKSASGDLNLVVVNTRCDHLATSYQRISRSVFSICRLLRIVVVLCSFLAWSFHSTAIAQQQEAAATTEATEVIELIDPEIDDAEFTLRLVSLTRGELEEFVKGWIKIVQVETKRAAGINIELSTAKSAEAELLRMGLERAVERRNLLFNKLELVLEEWEAKGAKPEDLAEYSTYVAAVRRSELKATDAKTLGKWFLDWLTSSNGGVKIGISLLSLIASLFGVIFLARILARILKRALFRIPEMSDLLRNFISKMAYWLILAVGIVIVLSLFGINMTPLLAVFGGASFVVGFAMQSTLGNLASGLLLMITKPFDVGDVVDAAGVSGTVRNVSIVSTTIVTFDNQVIVVPNTMVWESVITNVNASDIRRVDLTFGIGYGDDIDLAKKTLKEVLEGHPLVLDDPEPLIRMHELADSSVNLICRPWSKSDDYWTVYWDVLQQAKERFDAAGISIPFPQRDVHLIPSDDKAPST
jgi:small conductance mechanosensitive channel